MTSEVLTPLLVFIVGACLIYLAIPDSEELGITHQASLPTRVRSASGWSGPGEHHSHEDA
jgi:hypothetical protein